MCQKQPALEVVRKRLEAEGLGHRIVMVSDVNRDRETTIPIRAAYLVTAGAWYLSRRSVSTPPISARAGLSA